MSSPRVLFETLGWPLNKDTPEIASWNSLSKSSTANNPATEIKVGVFSYDVLALLEECVSTSPDMEFCHLLNRFDGWSIGIHLMISDAVGNPYTYGLCFASSKVCVKATGGDTSSYEANNYAKYPNFGSYLYDTYDFGTYYPPADARRSYTNVCQHNGETYFGLQHIGGFGHYGIGLSSFDNNSLGNVFGHYFWHF